MSKLNRFTTFIVAGLCLLLGWCTMPTAHYRYRLTIEIDTPTGVRSASAVHEVTWNNAYGVNTSFIAKMRAEAIFVALGPGPDGNPRNVVALVPDGDLVPKTFGYRFDRSNYQNYAHLSGVHEVSLDDPQLTLVSFTDVRDPASAKVVHGRSAPRHEQRGGSQVAIYTPIREMEREFGPGHALRRATIEMAEPGMWPFSTIAAFWPQWLFGTPLTSEIEGQLPALRETERWNLRAKAHPLGIGTGALIRNF